jgi:hypothetical protein
MVSYDHDSPIHHLMLLDTISIKMKHYIKTLFFSSNMKGHAGSVLLVPITPCKMWDPLVSWSMETICMRVFLLVMVTN